MVHIAWFTISWMVCMMSTFGLIVMCDGGWAVLTILVPMTYILEPLFLEINMVPRHYLYVTLHLPILHVFLWYGIPQWTKLIGLCLIWHVGMMWNMIHLRCWLSLDNAVVPEEKEQPPVAQPSCTPALPSEDIKFATIISP